MDHQPLTPYNILDFRAVVKHAYYAGGDDPEAIHCEDTDRRFPTWEYAAQTFLARYADILHGDMGSPRQLIVAHDMGHEYRSIVFADYKAKRKERERSPVEVEQIKKLTEWAKKFFTAIGATQIGVEGVEADDIIAWLCQNIRYPKQVFTVDADLVQLVTDDTMVYLKLEPQTSGELNGIPYHLTSISKSILGDKSDEYGGVRGLGPAKFQDLLDAYGEDGIRQLQVVIDSNNPALLDEAIEQTGDKVLIKLRESFGEWRQMWKLAQLHPELCWKPRGNKLTKPIIHKRVANRDKLHSLLAQAGADDMWNQFEPLTPRMIPVDADNWGQMRSAILDEISRGDITAFDYETADKEPNPNFNEAAAGGNFVDMLSHELTGASFQFGKHLENVIYVTVDHRDSANLPREVIGEIVEYASRHTTLVAQNAYFEGIISRTNLGLKLSNVHDTKTMQRYVDENSEAGLKSMSKNYLGYDQATFKETLGDKANMAELTLEEVFSYGVDDSLVTGALYDLLKLLLQTDGQWDFYQRWAVNPTCVLQDSFVNGVTIDWGLQKKLHRDDLATIDRCMAELREILEANVHGDVTPGAKSYIEAEGDYIRKSWRRKLRDDQGLEGEALRDAVKGKMYEWEKKWKNACRYTPYSEEEIMPKFAVTAKQLGDASEQVGLDRIEKVSASYLEEYLADRGYIGQGVDKPEDPKQQEFLSALQKAYGAGVLRMNTLEKNLEKAEAAEDEDKAVQIYDQIEAANNAKEHLGGVVQRLMGVEPKLVKTGDELSLNSPVQMAQLLYAKIGVPVRLRSTGAPGIGRIRLGIKENGPATDEKAIQTAIANDAETGGWQERALQLLLEAKSAQTRVGLYHTKYPLWKHHKDGKMHPTFTDAGTDTRRPTGSSPNLLQVSKKFPAMRDQFVPPSQDHVVVAIDYASQEIRLMACEANDPVMKSVYDPEDEKDLHSMTGSGIAGMSYEAFIESLEDTEHDLHPMVKAVRGKKAKGVNFGLAYGAGAATVSRNLIVPLEEAKSLLDDAFSLYARIKPWQEETAQFMTRNGFTLTAFGTKRHATDDLFNKDKGKVARQHRQGTNATIQGTAAEMLRIVLTRIWETDMLDRLDMVFFAPVYDEVVSFVHKDDVVQYCREMDTIMREATPPTHEVPQIPEFSIGHAWGSVVELGRWPGEEAIETAVADAIEAGRPFWEGEKAA